MQFLLIAALLPAIVLMVYVYRKDRVEKESIRLLLILALLGALSCIPAAIIEGIALRLVNTFVAQDTVLYAFIESFLVVAVAEEGCKHFFLRRRTWNSPEFNCTFDGIVYAVFVSLGFAALENVQYGLAMGIQVLGSRAIFSIPGHATYAVYMGLYYSRAKREECYGHMEQSRSMMRMSMLVPVLLHGFYDFCLLSGLESLALLFFVFVVFLDIHSIITIRRESINDQPIGNWYSF